MEEFKICYITAIYGNYESTCKAYVPQTIPSDFICFTDNPNIVSNGWIIDTTPYHETNKSLLDDGTQLNSISNNKHTFNIAKYYKQQFQNIPILKDYDVIVWLDGSIKLTNSQISEFIKEKMKENKIIGWAHKERLGFLLEEVNVSDFKRYTSTFWNKQKQPYQDIYKQYMTYIEDGYEEYILKKFPQCNDYNKDYFGVWITCFIAFSNKDPEITNFLNLWYSQTLNHTTQDQIGFPYVCYKTGITPYTLPDENVNSDHLHFFTDFYIKMGHGQ